MLELLNIIKSTGLSDGHVEGEKVVNLRLIFKSYAHGPHLLRQKIKDPKRDPHSQECSTITLRSITANYSLLVLIRVCE